MAVLKHQSVGEELTQAEWESVLTHVIGGEPAGDVVVVSQPPPGKCRIVNVYWDPVAQKAVFEFDDTPVP